ncbi:polymer-forming cytoskeletal protein [Roseibacillus persicicus]|uniref:bactofilin family protein n=1 Tax=Roseibacillus persicicus TaxID=454148 RepID=UPI00398B33F2
MQSTNCRGCHSYLKIEKGQAISPSVNHEQPRYLPNTEASKALPKTETSPPTARPTQSKKATQPKPEVKKSSQPAAKPASKPSLTTLPPTNEAPAREKPGPKTPLPPVPATSPNKEAAPAASIPQTGPRNPLRRKPNKPKAPPPPPKPAPLPPQESEERTPVEAAKPVPTPPPTERYRPAAAPPEPSKPAIVPLINREKKRSVRCFECDQEHEILADSTSALCPHCGAYIGLKHYDIKDQVNSRIQTRGNVFVHKKGYITGITIQCHNLTIEGEIQGGAECSGDFIVRKTGKINGPVTSDRVIIERRAEVDFMSTVTAREVIIDGHVTGSVACKKLTLKKRATLDGDLTVASLSIEEGARHTGNIQMTGLL